MQTKTATHTPGPWEVTRSESGRIYISGPEGDIGVLIHYEHAEADARLIAAAPALLAALEDAVRMLKARDKEYGELTTDIRRMETVIASAQ